MVSFIILIRDGTGLTGQVKEDGTAHCPASGINAYVVVAVLFNDGDQVPVMPSLDMAGSTASVSPKHNGPAAGKPGVIFCFTVIVNVVGFAHRPAVGVNV